MKKIFIIHQGLNVSELASFKKDVEGIASWVGATVEMRPIGDINTAQLWVESDLDGNDRVVMNQHLSKFISDNPDL